MPRLSPNASEFTVNTNSVDTQTDPSVIALAGGGYVITWTSNDSDGDGDGISAQIYDADGNKVGEEFTVNTEIENSQLHPDVAALADGGFVITWYGFDTDVDGDSTGVSAQIYTADGTAVGNEITVNSETTDDQYAPQVVGLADDGFVITWHSSDSDVDGDGYGISAQIFDADGDAIGDEFTVNTEVEGHQYHPSIAALEDGGFVITWYSYDPDVDGDADDITAGISAQRYDANGNAVGSEFFVATEIEDHQFHPDVAGLEGGGFVITWHSEDPDVDSDETGISGQLFDADGNPVGAEFTVNSESENDQYNPAVTALEGGGFVITWVSVDPDADGDRGAIAGQIFGADGNPVGDEFTVNNITDFNQLSPAVTGLDGGGFIAVWASEDPSIDGDGYGISARIFGVNVTEGSAGDDLLRGDDYDNILSGNNGADELYGQIGDDSIMGGDGADTIGGGAADDTLQAGDGDDVVYASTGDDWINGGAGDDLLFGGDGSDTIEAGTGNDTVYGGAGDDSITGGGGADHFYFAANHGEDLITDFDIDEDTLVLANTATNFNSIDDVAAAATNTDGGLLIDLGGGSTLFLAGIDTSDLAEIDIIL